MGPVEVGFSPPMPQRRARVALRVFLAIPHIFFAIPVAIAASAMVVAAWFAALAIGRLPGPLFRFLAAALRYCVRLNAYLYLLTDVYPPFTLKAVEYPVSMRVEPSRLNRAAVFFRILLYIPAGLLSGWLSSGVSVCLPVIWLIVLVIGRMPRTAFEAVAATMRFQMRCTA